MHLSSLQLRTTDNIDVLLSAGAFDHRIFALGGNYPTPSLAKCPRAKVNGIERKHAAIRLSAWPTLLNKE
jgi:hypothetical protein